MANTILDAVRSNIAKIDSLSHDVIDDVTELWENDEISNEAKELADDFIQELQSKITEFQELMKWI